MSIRYTKGLPIVSQMAEATCSRYELGARKRRVPRRGTSPPGTENFVKDTPGGYLYNICVAKKLYGQFLLMTPDKSCYFL